MIRFVQWNTRHGKRRKIRLYRAWERMHGRVSGARRAGNGSTPWKGLPVGFRNFTHFREWALANGFSKVHCSLDRKDDKRGYEPDNCRWVTVAQNTLYQSTAMWTRRRDEEAEYNNESDVPF